MAFSETAPLIAALKLDDKFSGPLKNAGKALGSFDAKLDHTQSRAFRAGQQIGTGIKNTVRIAAVGVGILVSQVALGLNSLMKLEQAQAQTAAVLKSTGNAAGVTGAQITELSNRFESLNATVGDEFIRAGANMLLTFTNIRTKAFEPALKAVLDMNTAMGKGPEGLTTTAILVGKALNDPIKGATALRRVGVQLDEQQIKTIKTLIKQNNLYGAQQIILAELNKEFGGSFLAGGGTTAAKIAKFTDSVEDLQRALAEALLPTLGNVADALSATLADPQVVEGVRNFGKALAGFVSPENLKEAGGVISSVIGVIKSSAPILQQAAGGMAAIVKGAVSAFRTLPPEIQKLAIAGFAVNKLTGGLITNIAGGIIDKVLKRGNSPASPLFVSDVSGGLGKGAGVVPAAGKLSRIASIATKVFIVGAAIGVFAELKGILDEQSAANKGLEADQQKQLTTFIGSSTRATLEQSLKGLQDYSNRLNREFSAEGFAFQLNIDGVRTTIEDEMARLRTAIAKLPQEQFGPPDPASRKNPVRPSSVDSIRTTPADMAAITAAIARGRAAGFKPTFASAQETLQRNISRAAEAALVKQDAIKSAILSTDTRSELAGIRSAIASAGQKPPTTNVKVTVNVTAAQVAKSVVIQKRFGPPGGSRESDAGHYGGAGT